MNALNVGRALWTTISTGGTFWSWLAATDMPEFLTMLPLSLAVSTIVTLGWFCLEARSLLQYDGRYDHRELIRR